MCVLPLAIMSEYVSCLHFSGGFYLFAFPEVGKLRSVGEYWHNGLLRSRFSVHVISICFLITTLMLFMWLWSNWDGMRKSFRFSFLCWKKKRRQGSDQLKEKGEKRQNSVNKSLALCQNFKLSSAIKNNIVWGVCVWSVLRGEFKTGSQVAQACL